MTVQRSATANIHSRFVPEQKLSKEPALLHEFLERAAARRPGNVAIEIPPSSRRPARRSITYADLNLQPNALARYLGDFVKEECVVAILLPRDSEHVYIAQVAALKAGAAYLCLDPAFPDEQVRTILDDARPVALLTDATGLVRGRRLAPD